MQTTFNALPWISEPALQGNLEGVSITRGALDVMQQKLRG